ncbi:MAG: colanic acid/amylovoran biosynthesis glycosyltransferase [Cellvibrionaceae bacterium]|jgi:colanic acid/amylovoran biosynthesis glycosyltransferase
MANASHLIGHLIINLIVKPRRKFFTWNVERRRLKAFEYADGIQANGSPAYNFYKSFGSCLLYFDTRVDKKLIINKEALEKRLDSLDENRPLPLAYSSN